MDNKVQLTTRIPRSIWKAARLQAIEDGVTWSDWVAAALEAHLRSPEKTGGLVGVDARGGAPAGRR